MSYDSALEAAGAKILAWRSFGSYHGDWWAKVKYKGKTGWVNGHYGSCSNCDAFQGEFGYSWDMPEKEYKRRLAKFGKSYLNYMLTQEEAEDQASTGMAWDLDADDMMKFVKENA